MQVYLVLPRDTLDIRQIDGAFRNFQDIKPSLLISYSGFDRVTVDMQPQAAGGPLISVEYYEGKSRRVVEFKVVRVSVWDSPTHM